jgi:all-trans-retinol dehydrogenase (NAD+)
LHKEYPKIIVNFTNKTVLITGGASGIGKIMGRKILERGGRLIIWDISEKNISDTLQELESIGFVKSWKVDISDRQQLISAANEVKQEIGKIDVLINNAGVIVGKYFHEHTEEEILRTMDINANAPMFVTQQFLQDMISNGGGHICNISSASGLLSNPKMSVYVGSKWAITGWSDSLRLEMEELKTGVGVTTVMPYYISTGMFDGVKSSIIPILKPEKAAEKIIRGIEQGKVFVKMPLIVQFVRLAQALLPLRVFDLVIGKGLGIYKTMAEFSGRK